MNSSVPIDTRFTILLNSIYMENNKVLFVILRKLQFSSFARKTQMCTKAHSWANNIIVILIMHGIMSLEILLF